MFEAMLIKQFAPRIAPAIAKGETELKKYLDGLELEPGETHATVLIDWSDTTGEATLVVAAFKNKTAVRPIAFFKKEQLFDLISKTIAKWAFFHKQMI